MSATRPMTHSARTSSQPYDFKVYSRSYYSIRFLENEYGYSPHALKSTFPSTQQHQQLIYNILKLEHSMLSKGLFPCVHAQPAPFTLAMTVENQLANRKGFFKRIRGFDPSYEQTGEAIRSKVNRAFQRGLEDDATDIRPYVTSCNYALFGSLENEESALWWGFFSRHNHNSGDAKNMLEQSMKKRGMADRKIFHFLKQADGILHGYSQLKTANFLVIGVPISLVNGILYDAKAYGRPSGQNLTQPQPDSHRQLRLLMCQESLNPTFGMQIVVANSSEETQGFCQEDTMSQEEQTFWQRWIEPKLSIEEKEQLERREALDAQALAFATRIQEALEERL